MRPIVQRDPPVRDPAHLKRVRQLPCMACGSPPPNVAHHISGRSRGYGQKISDHLTISLCPECHGLIHGSTRYGEAMRAEQENWLQATREAL